MKKLLLLFIMIFLISCMDYEYYNHYKPKIDNLKIGDNWNKIFSSLQSKHTIIKLRTANNKFTVYKVHYCNLSGMATSDTFITIDRDGFITAIWNE